MSEITETIQESVEHASESKLNSRVAIFVAITATFMAICNIKGGNIVQNMSKAQSKAVNNWAYFQSKSTKQNITENTIDVLHTELLSTASVEAKKEISNRIEKYKEKVDRYEKEKNEIKAEAEAQEKLYDDMNVFDDQFDMTEALLSIAVAMFGLTALTQKKPLFYFAITLSAIGFVLGTTAFMKISLHSDFIANLLG